MDDFPLKTMQYAYPFSPLPYFPTITHSSP